MASRAIAGFAAAGAAGALASARPNAECGWFGSGSQSTKAPALPPLDGPNPGQPSPSPDSPPPSSSDSSIQLDPDALDQGINTVDRGDPFRPRSARQTR